MVMSVDPAETEDKAEEAGLRPATVVGTAALLQEIFSLFP